MPERTEVRVRIPDPMRNWEGRMAVELCVGMSPSGKFICSRPANHARRHAASTGEEIIAVWERSNT